jgi:ELWxxDGT repeat protein
MPRKACKNAGRRRPSRTRWRRGHDAGLGGVQRLEPRHAFAVTPTLVADINPVTVGALADHSVTVYTPSYPYSGTRAPEFVSFAGRTFFPADDGIHGLELWVSDGTPGGTSLLKDINQTRNDFAGGSEPSDFFVAGDTLYFSANDGVHGDELWKTDGTAAGTVLVKDISQTPTPLTSSYPHDFARLADGTVLFVANGDGGNTLWKTDGTAAGTVRLDEGWATPLDSGAIWRDVTSLGTSVLFDNGDLWITDGTEANTRQLLSSAGTSVGEPSGFVTVTETVTPPNGFGPATSTQVAYFSSPSGLWRSDGTQAGTFQLANVRYNAEQSPPVPFGSFSRFQTEFPYGTVTGPRIVFAGDDEVGGTELWVSDGTAAGTVLRADINPAVNSTSGAGIGSSPSGFVTAGSMLYFSADDGLAGRELWAFDGTSVFQVADVAPGAISSSPVLLGAVGSTLYFSANNGVVGRELWKTDGLTTALVSDILPGSAASFVSRSAQAFRPAAVQGDNLLFAADDGQHGVELWASDGTAAGTTLVRDINTKTGDGVVATDGSGTFIGVAVIDGTIYFPADDGVHGTELWRRTGDEPPELVADIAPGAQSTILTNFTVSGGRLFFTAAVQQSGFVSGSPFSLWVTDGTASGTFPLVGGVESGFFTSALNGTTRYMVPFAGGVIFAASDTTHGKELWISNGTAAGTTLLADIFDDQSTGGSNGDSRPEWFTQVGGEVYFAATDANAGRQVWKTDGTAAGTVRVTSLSSSGLMPDIYPSELAAFDGGVVFAAEGDVGGVGLWRTDGLTTVKIADGPANPSRFVEVAGSLYFIAEDAPHGTELWVTDGTSAGTRLVKDINPGSNGSVPGSSTNGLFRSGDQIFFGAYDGTTESLWRSDGTAAGTVPVPLPEGVRSASSGNLVAANGLLYFTAEVGGRRVLYATDGTVAGGHVVELTPGESGSRGVALAATAGRLYFSVDDGVHGSEVWQLPLASAPPPDTVAPTMTIVATPSTVPFGGTSTITFTLSEPCTGFTNADVQVTGGTISGFTGSGTTYTATFAPDLYATSGVVFVGDAAFTDLAGNPNASASVLLFIDSYPFYDTVPPTIDVVASTAKLLVGQTATITFTLSEPAAAFALATIQATGGTLSNLTGSGTSYTALFTPLPDFLGTGEVRVAAGAFTDVAGNPLVMPASVTFSIDTQPPVAIGATSIPAGHYKAGTVLGFTVGFSEPVTVEGTPRIPLQVGKAWRHAAYVGNTDGSTLRFAYTVQPGDNTPVGDRTGPGVAGAIDLAGGSIRDPIGNDILPAIPAVGTADVVVDTIAPTVAVTSSQTLLGAGKTALMTFTLSEPSANFGPGSVSAAGGTLSGFTGSGLVYTALFTPQQNLTGTAVVRVDGGRFGDLAGNATAAAAAWTTTVDTALRFAAGTDGQSTVWDREFAYRAATATTIRLPLPASQAAFFAPKTVLSITPNNAGQSIVATVRTSRYDAATGSVVVTLDKSVPVTMAAGFGTLVLGGIVPPGARLLAGVSGAVVRDYGAADLLRAGYSPAFVTRFQGGLRTAAADLDDNGFADMIVAPGGVPNLPDPLAPGRRLADAFGSSLRTVAIFDGSPVPAWAPVKLDVGPVLGVATQGGFQVTTGNVVADAAGSAAIELIVASGTRLAVYDVRIAAPGARPVINPTPIRVVELGAGRTATGVAAGRLFAADPFDNVIVAATTASGRVAGTTTVSILAGAALGMVRSFPVTSQVESGPSRRLTDIYGFGASLAVGDIDGNGSNDLVLGAGAGGLGNFRVLANEFLTADPSQPAFTTTIAAQLGPGGRFAQYRASTPTWRPTGGPDYFTPGPVTGPTGQGFNAPVSVRVVNVSTTGSPRAEVFAALGAANQTANTVKRFLFTGPGNWTSAAAFHLLPSSATDMRFRRGAGVRLG